MHNKIKRAIGADRIMTVVFYCVAVFFFVLLAAFAGYVIIKGFMGATPVSYTHLTLPTTERV